MDTKFDELSTRIETIDRNAEAAETLAKQNQNNSDLTSESTALEEKLVEQVKKIYELELLRRTLKTRLTEILETR